MSESTPSSIKDTDIAIIGMSCHFPGAPNRDTFWRNIAQKRESITFFSDETVLATGVDKATLAHEDYVKAHGVLADAAYFDADFFDINPQEATLMDPQQRVFLEHAWGALEDAGYVKQNDQCAVGVFAGTGFNTYLLNNLYPNRQRLPQVNPFIWMLNNDKDFLTTRVSYKLNLKGPSVTLQTACSTSLVAVHVACQSLLSGECDMALAGGVSIHFPQTSGYLYQEGMIFSPDGHCRAFSADAKGTVGSDGVGIVVLKLLEAALADGDCVHAIVKGSAINNDGAGKIGFTAPSVAGQTAVVAEAQAVAEVDADSITYLEAHGTGTLLGDPIEIQALTKAFRKTTQKTGFCALGSVKTNIGHTNNAAGVAGLIKTIMALKAQVLPPNVHYTQANPQIDFAQSPFYVNHTLAPWQSVGPRRAGVSAFGLGGTNAHVIVEEAPKRPPSGPGRTTQLLLVSAKTATALSQSVQNLKQYLHQHADVNLADVAYTLGVGRLAFPHRHMLLSDDIPSALCALNTDIVAANASKPAAQAVVFLFPGQGAQYVNMGLGLYQTETVFRTEIDRCSAYLAPYLGVSLQQILYPSPDTLDAATHQLQRTDITQPALFVVSYAMSKLWSAYGIQPTGMLGHSLGEYVAACLAGVFSLHDALSLVATRGQMMQSLPQGAMLSITLPVDEVRVLLHDSLCLAAINSPNHCVVAGSVTAISALHAQLTQHRITCQQLKVKHAFHSNAMDPIIAAFTEHVRQVSLNPPSIPYISCVSGTWITPAQATDPAYWATQLRQTVRFAQGVETVLEHPHTLLEVGPGTTLGRLIQQQSTPNTCILSSVRHAHDNQTDVACWLRTIGQLWLRGMQIDWDLFYAEQQRHRLSLPTYPFTRQRYWIDPPNVTSPQRSDAQPQVHPAQAEAPTNVLHARPMLNSPYVAAENPLEQSLAVLWQTALGIQPVGINDNFFALGGDSLLGVQLIDKIRTTLGLNLSSNSLLSAPTIATMAKLSARPTASLLVTLQAHPAQKTPLFLVHPIGGSVYLYRQLANALDRPVYGIQAQGLDQTTPFLHDIKQMATLYLNLMREQQPHGPYYIGGASMGGMIAFEMAQQLDAANESIGLLVMFDTAGPGSLPTKLQTDADIIGYLLNISASSIDELRHLAFEQQLSRFLAHQRQTGQTILPDMDVRQAHHLLELFKVNTEAMWHYQPQVYSGSILFFRARQRDAYNSANPESAWVKLAQQGVPIVDVPGNHLSMHMAPHVAELAQHLNQCLKAAS